MNDWEDSMNKMIEDMRAKVIEDSYYNGSYCTQNQAYQAVRQRLEDAEPYIPMQFKSLYTAMRAGVLADIIDAGEEVRKHLK